MRKERFNSVLSEATLVATVVDGQYQYEVSLDMSAHEIASSMGTLSEIGSLSRHVGQLPNSRVDHGSSPSGS